MTRLLHFGYKFVDIDIGEIFPNFPLHESLQAYSGVDLSPFKEKISKEVLNLKDLPLETHISGHWTRLWFGETKV